MTTVYFSYATLTTPGHADIETITEAVCSIGIHPDRIAVHPQTVTVQDMTTRETAQMNMLDTAMANDKNLLSNTVPQ